MKNDDIYVWDIVQAAQKIRRYLHGRSEDDLLNDDMLFDAVVREFQVLGEAANMLSHDVKSRYPQVPWREIVDMRNVMVHEYSRIEVPILWSTAMGDLPLVLNALLPLYESIQRKVDSGSADDPETISHP